MESAVCDPVTVTLWASSSMMQFETLSLGLEEPAREPSRVPLGPGAVLLTAFACEQAQVLIETIDDLLQKSPLRHMVTPGGWTMSVAMTNCGEVGWVTDRTGYRYDGIDPDTGSAWPEMPAVFASLATSAAAAAGYSGFVPDACLVNQYSAGARLSLHQDKNERDMSAPIVSVSLGLPAVFLWGGDKRAQRPIRVSLLHGDVVVWGGADRLRYHGVHSLAEGIHPMTGAYRYNLTFRKAR
jgi:alkylated DNA repair protein (DNA oxidative demethylase)